MNLYLLERTDSVGYDEFDSIVVATPTEDAARATFGKGWGWTCFCDEDDACDCGDGVTLSVKHIGTTNLEEGLIHSSFCAG